MVDYLKVDQYTLATDETEAIIDREFYRKGYLQERENLPILVTTVHSLCLTMAKVGRIDRKLD